MKTTHILPLLTLSLSILSCENPADKTTKATIKDATTKTTNTIEGATKYTFTTNSSIGFVGSKITGSHTGGFKTFTGYFTLKDGKPAGNDHKVIIDMSTTFSDDPKLTGHLKSPDFFDVEKFPQATFDVTNLTPDAQNPTLYQVTGNLTLHGITKNINFPANATPNQTNFKIAAEFNINRKDFNINYPGKANDLIRDEVVIKLNLDAQPTP